ncbi:protein adenylyltransferase SelO family protein, partial [Micrococcus luteus]
VGFVHGVMNTDNMTLSGETIDYGPCAFIDAFDPAASFSSIDTQGRYAYGNQGPIAAWNLARLGEALVPVLDDDPDRAVALAQEALGRFHGAHLAAWRGGLRDKLGLPASVAEDDVAALTDRLFPWLAAARADWTSFWVRVAEHTAAPVDDDAARTEAARLVPGAPDPAGLAAWLADWRAMGPDPARMRVVNPVNIPRNHLLDEALTAAEGGDLTPVHRLLEAVTDPFTPRPGFERYAEPGPADGAPFVTYCGT